MKKIIMGAVIFFLLLITILLLTGRVSFGSFKILGVEDIKVKSKELDDKISEISDLTTTKYKQKYAELEAAQKTMLQSKQDYEDKLAYSTQNEIESANKLENYNIEFLWTKIGRYATQQGIGLKLEVQNGTTQDLKNLVFAATGKYIPITDFVYSLENDAELNFTIDNFKLEPNSSDGSVLIASFTVADISMNVNSVTYSESSNNANKTTTTTPTVKLVQIWVIMIHND